MSDDLIEKADRVISRLDPQNQGFYQAMPPEEADILVELLAETKRLRAMCQAKDFVL
jgi:uncharacterized protein YcgL (UPF0745 family)